MRVVLASLLIAGAVAVAGPGAASADAPDQGPAWVVTVGDSAISGESGTPGIIPVNGGGSGGSQD